MPLNTDYIVGINVGEYFVDQATGLPLAGGLMYFYKDTNRSLGKPAYYLTGSPPNYTYTQLSNPLTLSASGTPIIAPDNPTNIAVYFYPFDNEGNLDLYYIEVRDSTGAIIEYTRQAWPNVGVNQNPLNAESGLTDNQILNSQFIDVFFEPQNGITFSWTGVISGQVFPIGSGWEMIVSASNTGSIVVNQTPLTGILNLDTNPPYALDILPEGAFISSIQLRQTMLSNPSIWANNILSGFMLVASQDGLSHEILMTYSTSVPNVPQTIIDVSTGTAGYVSASGTLTIGDSLNTETPPSGQTFIDIFLPTSGHVSITSVQVVPIVEGNPPASYIQNSFNQEQSKLFCYYNPLIQSIPAPSVSEGWDFKLNPAQFGSTVSMASVASQYLWDQTIGWQNVNSLVTAQRDAVGDLQINLSTTGQFALVQYLSAAQMDILFSNGWSTLINAYTDITGGAAGTVSFWYTTDGSLPNVASGSNLSLINTLDSNGKPNTFHGNWTELPNPYIGNARFIIPRSTSHVSSPIALNGWAQPLYGISSTATFCAIVIGFSSLTTGNIFFDSISVTPGRLSVPFSPLSYDLTLNQLEYYYEKSYDPINIGGDITSSSQIMYPYSASIGSGVSTTYRANSFGFVYRNCKRVVPLPSIFSPITGAGGTSGDVCVISADDSSSHQDVSLASGFTPTVGTKALQYIGTNSTTISGSHTSTNPLLIFQYTLDSRYGIV